MIKENLTNDTAFIAILCLLIIATIIARVLLMKIKTNKINKPLSAIALYSVAFCLLLCLISSRIGVFQIKTSGNPKDTVTFFYDSILLEDYEKAYCLLNNCSTLGLENQDSLNDDEANKLITKALKNSYSYSISDDVAISGLNAVSHVDFTYLDVKAFKGAIATYIDPLLNKKIELLSKDELYTDDGHYKKDLMEAIYIEAIELALNNAQDYYKTTSYDVTLVYSDGQWFLNSNDYMIRGFTGGQ